MQHADATSGLRSASTQGDGGASVGSGGAGVSIALAVGVLAVSFAALFFDLAAPTHPIVASGIRLGIAALVMSPVLVAGWWGRRVTRRHLVAAVIGGLCYAVHFGAWVASLGLTSTAASVTLVCATPMFLAVVGIVRGVDRPRGVDLVAIAIASVGLLVIGGADFGSGGTALLGDGLALLGALAMVAYMLVVRDLGASVDALAFSAIATTVGAVVLLGVAAAMGLPLVAAGPYAWWALVAAALVPQVVGHTALTWVLRHTSPTTVGIAVLAEPVIATLLAAWLLGEGAGITVLLGCAVTLVGVGLVLTRGGRREHG
jgi:drug/metabolite transporter (DMT)-like permease